MPANLRVAGPTVEIFLGELTGGFVSFEELGRVVIRLLAAMLLGAVVGLQREFVGAAAGLRTHMLVALAATMFVLIPPRAGMSPEDLSRVIQGVATGIGFIGAGAILKLTSHREIHGLTTAASIWLTTAIGVAVGVGRLGVATVSVVLAWMILSVFARAERYFGTSAKTGPQSGETAAGDKPSDALSEKGSAVTGAALPRPRS